MRHGSKLRTSVSTGLLIVFVLVFQFEASAESGLLLIAHGAPSTKWNAPVLHLGKTIAKQATDSGKFKAVRTAMLEFTQPDIPTCIAQLEAKGCDRIVAIPLFVAPSDHTHFDVPAALGIYSSPRTRATIAEEGGHVAKPRVPVVLTATLSEGKLLRQFVVSEVQRLSKNPAEEAVVLLAHGDSGHSGILNELMRQLTTYCCGRTGIDYGDWAFVKVGQGYRTVGLDAIQRALKTKQRVIVVGVYVSLSARQIHQRAMATSKHSDSAAGQFGDKEVLFSDRGIVDDPRIVDWIMQMAGGTND